MPFVSVEPVVVFVEVDVWYVVSASPISSVDCCAVVPVSFWPVGVC